MITALVVLIAAEPGMADRMLAEHVDDGTGHCRMCRWHARPAARFPCILRTHAEAAVPVADRPAPGGTRDRPS